MIYLTCECGSGVGVPGSFLGEPVHCDECGRTLRLVAGQALTGARRLNWRLEVRSAPDPVRRGEHLVLGGSMTVEVGSEPARHLVLPGDTVSPSHCRLIPTPDGWTLEDAGSEHGVFVNGERVRARALSADDIVDVGAYELHYAPLGARKVPEPARPRPAAHTPGHSDASHTSTAPPRIPARDDLEAIASATATATVAPAPAPVPASTIPCPCCRRALATDALICVDCGIDLRTGRPLLTAQGLDEDTLRDRAWKTIWVLSWLIPFGIFPIASEARGDSKPYAVWAITLITVVASFLYFAVDWATDSSQLPAGAGLMLWAGDRDAAAARSRQLLQDLDEAESAYAIDPDEAKELRALAVRPTMDFRPHQLLTHALLHIDVLHLAGNLLFLLVLGTRVNALLGNVKTAILYPLLAVAGGMGHLLTQRHAPASPMLGASGAIMGLAGMYLVLFPAHRVHMAVWIRVIFLAFRLGLTFFAIRGFWVVLFYIAFDVSATLLGAELGVAHWAHLGGFIAGVAVALLLLVTRLVNAHGGDILSVAFGRYAWAVVGRPGRRAVS